MSAFDLDEVIRRLTVKVANDVAALDSSLSSEMVIDLVTIETLEDEGSTVNGLEQTSLKALVAWTAENCHMNENHIVERLTKKFEVGALNKIEQRDFDEAIAWLIDFKPVLN